MVPHAANDAGIPVFLDSEFRSAFCRDRARGGLSNRDATLLGLRIYP
jgi:hypothetical protein